MDRGAPLIILGIVALVAVLGLILSPAFTGKYVWWPDYRQGGSPEARGELYREAVQQWAAASAEAQFESGFVRTCRLDCQRDRESAINACIANAREQAGVAWTNWVEPCKKDADAAYRQCLNSCGTYYQPA